MNEKSRKRNQNRLEACRAAEKKEKQGPAPRPKPHWTRGLRLPPTKDVTCFTSEDLAVILSRPASEQLFGYAYSTMSEIFCLEYTYNQGWQLQNPCDNRQHSECTATCPYYEKRPGGD